MCGLKMVRGNTHTVVPNKYLIEICQRTQEIFVKRLFTFFKINFKK